MLPAATLPLSGTELIPLVQGGTTKEAPASAFGGGGISGVFSLTSLLAVGIAAGTTNDWAPALAGVSRLEVTAAGLATVTGLAGGTDGRVMVLTNVGVNDILLSTEDVLSVVANRFSGNGDFFLVSGASVMFLYSVTLNRWTRMGS